MNTNRFLSAVAAVAIVAGAGNALAQQEPPRNAPAEKIAPKIPAGEIHKNTPAAPAATPGTAPRGVAGNGTIDEKRKNAAEERGQHQNVGQQPHRETTGQAPQNERKDRATEGRKGEPNRAAQERTNNRRNAHDSERRDHQNGGARPADRQQTTGQGAASSRGSVSANITPEQRTRIHDIIIKEHSAPRLDHVDFSLSVGTVVPRSVRLIAVPRVILEIEPEWRGFVYFLVGDEIIIVNPRSMEIVAVLDV